SKPAGLSRAAILGAWSTVTSHNARQNLAKRISRSRMPLNSTASGSEERPGRGSQGGVRQFESGRSIMRFRILCLSILFAVAHSAVAHVALKAPSLLDDPDSEKGFVPLFGDSSTRMIIGEKANRWA